MVVKSSIYSDYKTWCLGQNIKPEDERIFGKAIDRLIPKSHDTRPSATTGEPRLRYRVLPSLETAREDFQKAFKVGGEIWSL